MNEQRCPVLLVLLNMMKHLSTLLLISSLHVSSASIAAPPSAKQPWSKVKYLYARSWKGDTGFSRRLKNELTDMGFVWTRNQKRADAFVDAQGQWRNGGFDGYLKIVNRSGQMLWSQRVHRPRGSNLMAYQRLADKLRSEIRNERS